MSVVPASSLLSLLAPKLVKSLLWGVKLNFNILVKKVLINMDESVRRKLEYEEQFFGMSSQFFTDCFRKLIQDELDSKIIMLVENLRGKLLQQAKNTENFESALKKMKEIMTTEYQKALDNLFPEIESKISDFIHIPSNILLKEDLPVKIGINGDLNEIKEEIKNLKGIFSSLLYLKQKMLEELEEADSAIFFMEYVTNQKKLDFNVLPVEEISALSKANNYLINNES